ncbi:MAG: hypothetical protein HWE12_07065, partial [Oceanospirillaceae bacterium]|nr:hypothetical protein [Oceanospirillaceae bacterium]
MEEQQQVDPNEVLQSFAKGIYFSELGYALSEIESLNLTEAQKRVIQLDLVTKEFELFLASNPSLSESGQKTLDQLKHFRDSGDEAAAVLTDKFDRYAAAMVAGNLVGAVDIALTLQSYSSNLEEGNFGDGFAEAVGVLTGSMAARAAVSLGYTGPVTAAATFLVGFAFEWAL